MQSPSDGEQKFFQMVQVNDQAAAIPIYVKALKIFFSGTKKSDDLETWYAASGTRVLSICSYDDSGLILTYFTEMSILVSYAFVWENVKTMDFFRNYCSLWYQSW